MSVLSSELRDRVVARHHTVTAAELVADGVHGRDIRRWIAADALAEVAPGVFAVTQALAADPFATRAAALALSGDDVCDPVTSARCWGLPGVFRPARPTTMRRDSIPAGFVVERRDGIRLLSPAATWFGLAGVLTPDRFVEWSDEILGRRVDVGQAHRVVAQLARPDRAAHRRAAAVLSSRRRWQRPGVGELERRVRASFRRRGFHGLDGAHTLPTRTGILVHPTVTDHARRWALEIDHRSWHGGRHGPAARNRIVRDLARTGWSMFYVSDTRLRRDFTGTMREVVAMLPSP